VVVLLVLMVPVVPEPRDAVDVDELVVVEAAGVLL
jgi:hypothetical protein